MGGREPARGEVGCQDAAGVERLGVPGASGCRDTVGAAGAGNGWQTLAAEAQRRWQGARECREAQGGRRVGAAGSEGRRRQAGMGGVRGAGGGLPALVELLH